MSTRRVRVRVRKEKERKEKESNRERQGRWLLGAKTRKEKGRRTDTLVGSHPIDRVRLKNMS